MFPASRPRRLRASAPLRRLVAGSRLDPAQLVLPVFVREGAAAPVPVASMPGVVNHTLDSLRDAVSRAADHGVGGVMIFGVPERRDAMGSGALDPQGILNRAVADVVAEVGSELVVMADLCLDEFTDHGHCGLLGQDGTVDNDATLQQYSRMAVALAESGAHVVGTSGMMDGQVAAVRTALESAGHVGTIILAYAAKHASAYYGPFREAVDSALVGDRRTYQQDPGNAREAHREIRLDLAEGADMVMVKPAGTNLDLIAAAARLSDVPVAAYQVSGEFAMIEAAAQRGWLDRDAAVMESLVAIRRAGADVVLTYWADEVAGWLRSGQAERLRGHVGAGRARDQFGTGVRE